MLSLLKIVIASGFVYLLWSVTKFVLRVRKIMTTLRGAAGMHKARQTQPKQDAQKAMVKCAQCQLYVIDSDAINQHGQYFCSPEHAAAFR